MNKKIIFTLILSSIFASGCAHFHEVKGTETQSEIPAGTRVSIGSKEVKEGEKVDVFKRVCTTRGGGRRGHSKICRNDKLGEATVLKVLDEDSSIVQPDQGVVFEPGLVVEKRQ